MFRKHDCDATSPGSLLKCLRRSREFVPNATSRFCTVLRANASLHSALLELQDLKISSGCDPYREDDLPVKFEIRKDVQDMVDGITAEKESAVGDLTQMWREYTQGSRDAYN